MKRKFADIPKASLILCGVLFFLLFFGPFLNKIEVIFILLLGLGSKGVERKKVKRYIVHFLLCLLIPIGIGLAAYLIGLLKAMDEITMTSVVLHVGIAGFLIVYAIDSLTELMKSHQTGLSEVLGALNTYMIIGFIYGEAYALIAYFIPKSFTIARPILEMVSSHISIIDSWVYIYFSFVTQTSLGFGDITPVSHLVQVLVISQTIFGQFYIAIVLAYLLHNYIAQDEAKWSK